MPLTKGRFKRRGSVFVTFLLCCLSASLIVAAFATPFWFQGDIHNIADASGSGSVNFGLFDGARTLVTLQPQETHLYVVCDEGICMYSCGTSKEYQMDDLASMLDGRPDDFSLSEKCDISDLTRAVDGPAGPENKLSLPLGWSVSSVRSASFLGASPLGEALRLSEAYRESVLLRNSAQESEWSSTEPPVEETTPGGEAGYNFMDYGLWVATIASLAAGMLFAVVGALFAVINTATTPVEAITGVPGLYVWNTLAALFNLVCVICWAVQFHTRLTRNVLVRDSLNGWTTEGHEVFGYSYWLVVVAILVHIANCVIIGVGTYEPRRKEVVHAPHVNKQDNNILLY